MSKEEKPKLKMTPEELLEEVRKIIEPFKTAQDNINERISGLENKEQKIEVPTQDQDFSMNVILNHFKISPERQQEFLRKLAGLMRDYKVFSVKADLIRKF